MANDDGLSLIIQPIGFIKTESRYKFDAPSQPDAQTPERNFIELLPETSFELAVQDLEGFDRIWIVSWFHRNKHWRPRVLPPRGPATRRGVFATRSPHRPNPIGLTSTPLLSVKGRILEVGAVDLVDGTPVLDIKPYLRTVDCHPGSSLGWLEEIEAAEQAEPRYRIVLAERAESQLAWLLTEWGIDFTDRAFRILRRDPSPHRTRRILQLEANRFRMACGAWRIFFRVEAETVVVEEVGKGYSDEALHAPGHEKILDRDAQVAFAVHW